MAWRRAIGVVKDQTSIGLAIVSNSSNSLSDLEVAIVKATRHEEYPAEEKYIREILSLTTYSRHYIGACVNTICRRLNKTKNWVVALKTLMLIQRLLQDGDPAYEQEIFFATRRGSRLLNLSDFQDSSRSNSWDYSAFVRTYALYLDERLEHRMQGERRKHNGAVHSYLEEDDKSGMEGVGSTPSMQILSKLQHLMQLLERFLATRPTGTARRNRIVLVAVYQVLKESFEIYYEATATLGTLIDKFMELDVPECAKVYEIFRGVSKQLGELDAYYSWCKDLGMGRTFDFPDVERIASKKLKLIDEFIRDKAANDGGKEAAADSIVKEVRVVEEDPNHIEGGSDAGDEKNGEQKEADLLDLGADAVPSDERGDKLALALIGGGASAPAGPPPEPAWVAFGDWETALVRSTIILPQEEATASGGGGGIDLMLLDELYQRGTATDSGGTRNPPLLQMLSLPLPARTPKEVSSEAVREDPFAASIGVAPPPYVQMAEVEKKQMMLVEEQMAWQQYARGGHRMQGEYQAAWPRPQQHSMGGCGYGYGYYGGGYGCGFGYGH